jgi:hypothetical protein
MVLAIFPASAGNNYSMIIRNRLSDLSLLVAQPLFATVSSPVTGVFLPPLADTRHFFRPAPAVAIGRAGAPAFLAGCFAGLLAALARAVFLVEGGFGIGCEPSLAAMAPSLTAAFFHGAATQ